MKLTKRCEYILEDGHKCNAVFSHKSGTPRKYCDNHIGNNQNLNHLHGHHKLVNSTNAYAGVANAQTMQEWVKHKMNMEQKDKKKIEDLETKVARLERLVKKKIKDLEHEKRVMKSFFKEQMKTQHFRAVIDSLIVKRLHKSARHIPKPDDKRGDEDA